MADAPKKRSPQTIAIELVEKKLDKEDSFVEALNSFEEAFSEEGLTPSRQMEDFGMSDFLKRAKELKDLIAKIAEGQLQLSHPEKTTLENSLAVVNSSIRYYNKIARFEQGESQDPDNSFIRAIAQVDIPDEDIRAEASQAYYRNINFAKALKSKAAPLLKELGASLGVRVQAFELE